MTCLAVGLLALCLAAPAATPAPGAGTDYEQMATELVAALNRVRAKPASLVPALQGRLKHFAGHRLSLPGEITLVTNEGAAAVEEAIGFLKRADALPPVKRSAGMSKAAADHARELGERGSTGHYSADGTSPADRLNRHGRWKGTVAENIAFGPTSGARMVLQLIVDDGVAGRHHRSNFFKAKLLRVGVACGPHPTYRTVCVIDLAADYLEDPPAGKKPAP